jgi:hypothetical protein
MRGWFSTSNSKRCKITDYSRYQTRIFVGGLRKTTKIFMLTRTVSRIKPRTSE